MPPTSSLTATGHNLRLVWLRELLRIILNVINAGFAYPPIGQDGRNPLLDEDTAKGRPTEMALHVLAYNLTRVINILRVQPLLAAMRAY
jgi:hypothetical protein